MADASAQEAQKYLNKQLAWLSANARHDREVAGRARIEEIPQDVMEI